LFREWLIRPTSLLVLDEVRLATGRSGRITFSLPQVAMWTISAAALAQV
jgi:hypothetical protein